MVATSPKEILTLKIKSKALSLGFSSCGVVKVEELKEEALHLQEWLDNGFQAEMSYMKRNFEKRINPSLLVENAKSMLVLTLNYHPHQLQGFNAYKIARYAYGEDYHAVMKQKLYDLFHYINQELHPVSGRVFVDSAPVLERVWAKKAGLGWVGKNSLLINKKQGSYFFIAELILDLELEYDYACEKSYCGSCSKCIEACPTKAIVKEGQIDASKCISYQTIENKEEIPAFFADKMQDWIFGCDICQEVCPWNSRISITKEPRLKALHEFLSYTKKDWENLTEEKFNQLFAKSALKRTKFNGIKRNVDFVSKNGNYKK